MIRIRALLLCAALAVSVGVASAAAGGGNSDNAKLCQSGWLSWLRADGTPFANQGACVAYAAHGGILTTFTTSTTSHTTFTRVDLPAIQAYETQVTSATDDGFGFTAYNDILPAPPDSDEVNAAFASAQDALRQALEVESRTRPTAAVAPSRSHLPRSCQVRKRPRPCLLVSQPDHIQTTTTTTTTIGPATAYVGPDQSQAFSVVAGTQNINTDTHTESFINQLYQTTVTTSSAYLLTGTWVHG